MANPHDLIAKWRRRAAWHEAQRLAYREQHLFAGSTTRDEVLQAVLHTQQRDDWERAAEELEGALGEEGGGVQNELS